MIGRRDELASMQSTFYRDQYRKTLRAIVFSLGVIFVLIFMVVYCVIVRSPLSFYGTATSGQIIPMISSEAQ